MSETYVVTTPAKKPGGVNLDPQQKFALRLVESAPYTYIGKAVPGSSESDSVWQIFRMDATSGLDIEWADGDSSFDNVWSNYATLSYS